MHASVLYYQIVIKHTHTHTYVYIYIYIYIYMCVCVCVCVCVFLTAQGTINCRELIFNINSQLASDEKI